VIEAFEVLELNYIRLKDKIQSQENEKKKIVEETDIKFSEMSKKCTNFENTIKNNHEELLQLKNSILAHSKSFNESLQKISELHQELENSETKISSLQKQTEDQSSYIIKLTESVEQSSRPTKEFLKSVKHLKSKQKSITKSWSITKQAQDLIGSYTQSYISQVENLIEKLKSQEENIGLLEEKLRNIGMMYENEDNKMKKYKKKYKILSDKFNELTSDYEVVYREYTYVSEQLQSQKSLNSDRMAGTISLYEGKIKALMDELNASKA
jgi:chromosome segregation ATPase